MAWLKIGEQRSLPMVVYCAFQKRLSMRDSLTIVRPILSAHVLYETFSQPVPTELVKGALVRVRKRCESRTFVNRNESEEKWGSVEYSREFKERKIHHAHSLISRNI